MELAYREAGSGRPLVLLHAFPLSSTMWLEQRDGLGSQCRVITPDQRGFGGSPPSPDGSRSWAEAELDRDITRLAAEFPKIEIRWFACPREMPNGKVGVLAELAGHARHPGILVNDSDIVVESDYLHDVVGPLENASFGLVTCLYRAHAANWPARCPKTSRSESEFPPG